ncbi:MAG: sulfate ABC transporter substrate-binding protein [Cyanobacteria bacterium]|nr:sulfate ABC transporter substrate-binding protein [Cyanobacteriota bacterium]
MVKAVVVASRGLCSSLLAVVAAGVLLGGCAPAPGPGAGGKASAGKGDQELLLVSYAVTKAPYDRILPLFQADWKARTGQNLTIRASYGPSGVQTRAILDGIEADVATLALAGDVEKLQEGGLVQPGWQKELPHNSMITESVVVLVPRKGNPGGVQTWSDLARPGLAMITANPKTSGGARWNFLGLWGSNTQSGGSEAQARTFVSNVYRKVDNLPKDSREAADLFLKRGIGDVLLTYENEAILAKREGLLESPFLVPSPNIRIEGPVVVIDRNVDRRGTRKAAEALATYFSGPQAQKIFAEEGFRPVNPSVWAQVRDRFAPVSKLYSAAAFGGWTTINSTFFSKGGIWDQLFAATR